jgi:hypothetical protein
VAERLRRGAATDGAHSALDSEVLRDSVTAPQRKGTLLLIKVTDPIKRDDSTSSLSVVGKKYVEYLVSTTATRAGSQVRHTASQISLSLLSCAFPCSLVSCTTRLGSASAKQYGPRRTTTTLHLSTCNKRRAREAKRLWEECTPARKPTA